MLWKVTFSSAAALHSRRHIAVVSFRIGARRRYTKTYRWTWISANRKEDGPTWRADAGWCRPLQVMAGLGYDIAASASPELGTGQEHPRVSAFVRCQKAVSSRGRPSWLSCDFCDCQACTFANPLAESLIRR